MLAEAAVVIDAAIEVEGIVRRAGNTRLADVVGTFLHL